MRKKENEKQLRNLFQAFTLIEASRRALARIRPGLASEQEALEALLDVVRRFARRPSPAELAAQGPAISRQYDPVGRLVFTWAVVRWFRTEPGLSGLVSHFVMEEIRNSGPRGPDAVPARRMLYEAALELPHFTATHSPLVPILNELIACELCSDPDLRRQEIGLERLEALVAYWREQTVLDPSISRSRLAKVLYNLATSLKQHAETPLCPDPRRALERALAAHDEAIATPERMDPVLNDTANPLDQAFLSYRERAACLRALAALCEDAHQGLAFVDRAMRELDQADELAVRMGPSGAGHRGSIIVDRSNLVTRRCRLLADLGTLASTDALDQLAACERALASPLLLDSPAAHLVPQARVTVAMALQELGGAASLTAEAVLGVVRSAIAASTDANARGVPSDRLRVAAHHLLLLLRSKWANTDSERLPVEFVSWLPRRAFWEEVAEVTGLLVPGAVTAEALDEYFDAMELWFRLYALVDRQGHALDIDLAAWARQLLKLARDGLCEASLSSFERRVFARVFSLWGTWPGLTSEDGPAHALCQADVMGSIAWRSDLSFYGSGPQGDARPGIPPEAVWRCDLFRARFRMDTLAVYLHLAARGRHDESMRAAAQEALAMAPPFCEMFDPSTPPEQILHATGVDPAAWVESADGIGVPIPLGTLGDVRAQLERTRHEWMDSVERGGRMGFTLYRAELPIPSPDELLGWLTAHPDTVILIPDPRHELAAFWSDGKGGLHKQSVALSEELLDVMGDYLIARDEHSFGPDDREGFRRRAAQVGPERTHFERIATPEASSA